MIVWGGEDRVGTRLNTGGKYDVISDAWSGTVLPCALCQKVSSDGGLARK
jgi:hypothetical protein